MKESEARAKWCPFALNRVIPWRVDADTIRNQIFEGPFAPEPQPNCIGPSCMAWRWHVRPLATRADDEGGYCGLAGEP